MLRSTDTPKGGAYNYQGQRAYRPQYRVLGRARGADRGGVGVWQPGSGRPRRKAALLVVVISGNVPPWSAPDQVAVQCTVAVTRIAWPARFAEEVW